MIFKVLKVREYESIVSFVKPMSDDHRMTQCPGSKHPKCSQSYNARRGKVSSSLLPPEIELSRFVADFKNTDPSWSSSTPACKWSGIICLDSTRPEEVTNMEWHQYSLRGTPNWKYIPHSVLDLNMFENFLTGELPLDVLPLELKFLYLGSNQLNGSLPTQDLPSSLIEAYLWGNSFSSTLDLSILPITLTEFSVAHNKFFGSLNLTTLPRSMTELQLENNAFTGSIDLGSLPPSMNDLNININRIEHVSGLNSLPLTLRELNVTNNNVLTGEFDKVLFPPLLNFVFDETLLKEIESALVTVHK